MMTTKIRAIASDPRDPELDQASDAGLDQEGDGAAQHEGAQEVADEVEDDDRDHERSQAEGDLEVAPAALGIHGQGGHHDGSGLFRLDGVSYLF